MTPNVYRAADGWTSEDIDVIQLLTSCLPAALDVIRTRARLLNWIKEAPKKEPAR